MNIIKNPWQSVLHEFVSGCENTIKITSPFIKTGTIKELLKNRQKSAKFTFVTSFKLMNFYRGASDLEAIEKIIENDGVVKNFQSLHSKIYIFDDRKVVVTSANLTAGGLIKNFEYGIVTDDKKIVKRVADDFNELCSSPLAGQIRLEEIAAAKNIIESTPREKEIRFPRLLAAEQSGDFDVYTGGIESIAKNIEGWKLDVFNCLLKIKSSNFRLKDIYDFEDRLKTLHPENRNVRPKIRQQLQLLRDIGLVEFVSPGNYRKLWL